MLTSMAVVCWLDCCNAVTDKREGSLSAANGLRQGSVLDMLCPPAQGVTVVKPAAASGML